MEKHTANLMTVRFRVEQPDIAIVKDVTTEDTHCIIMHVGFPLDSGHLFYCSPLLFYFEVMLFFDIILLNCNIIKDLEGMYKML